MPDRSGQGLMTAGAIVTFVGLCIVLVQVLKVPELLGPVAGRSRAVPARPPSPAHVQGLLMSSTSADAREWHRVICASVRECLETFALQAKAGAVTVEALEAILARATVPILSQAEGRPPELVVALLPSLVRTMLATFVEMMAEGDRAS